VARRLASRWTWFPSAGVISGGALGRAPCRDATRRRRRLRRPFNPHRVPKRGRAPRGGGGGRSCSRVPRSIYSRGRLFFDVSLYVDLETVRRWRSPRITTIGRSHGETRARDSTPALCARAQARVPTSTCLNAIARAGPSAIRDASCRSGAGRCGPSARYSCALRP